MELDDLKQNWDDQERKLDAGLRLNTRLLHTSKLGRAETAIRRLARLLWMGLSVNAGLALWLGSFLGDHWSEPRFLIPAAALHLGVLALLAAGIHQLAAIRGLDFSAPVVTIQKRLESLRAQRIRAVMLTLLASPLAWIPMLIVSLKGLLGVDAYAVLDRGWLIANVLCGLAVIPVGAWAARRFADRLDRSPLARRLLRDLAGYNLSAATGFLDSLAELERGA
jgi:serine/threonine-protein kinase